MDSYPDENQSLQATFSDPLMQYFIEGLYFLYFLLKYIVYETHVILISFKQNEMLFSVLLTCNHNVKNCLKNCSE